MKKLSLNSAARGRSGGLLISLVLAILIAMLGAGYILLQHEVTVYADGRTIAMRTHQANVAGLLDDAGVELLPADQVLPPPDESLKGGMEITVERARVVTVDVDGRLLTRRTRVTSVADLFDEWNIELSPADQVVADGVQIWPSGGDDFIRAGPLPKRIIVNRSLRLVVDDDGVRLTFATLESNSCNNWLQNSIGKVNFLSSNLDVSISYASNAFSKLP